MNYFRKDLMNKKKNEISIDESFLSIHLNEAASNPMKLLTSDDLIRIREVTLHKYAKPSFVDEFKGKIAEYVGNNIRKDQITLGNGIDDLLYYVFMALNDGNSSCIINPPTYPDYFNYGSSVGLNFIQIPLVNFHLDLMAIRKAAKNKHVKAIIICSPNNPSGNMMNMADILALLEFFPDKLFIIDEAYFEYAGKSFLQFLSQYHNIIILRGFSKGFLAPGLRLGYAISSTQITAELKKIYPAFNVSSMTMTIGSILLEKRESIAEIREQVIAERERVFAFLSSIPKIKVYPSLTNFLLFSMPPQIHKLMLQKLSDAKITVRDVSKLPGCEGMLRVSIGAKEDNDAFCSVAASMK